MPDPRDPHAAERLAERERAYNAAMVDLNHTSDAHLTAAAIVDCPLCDPDGYRPNGRVCDHIDRTKTAAAGSAKARAALSNIGRRNSTTDVALTEGEPE